MGHATARLCYKRDLILVCKQRLATFTHVKHILHQETNALPTSIARTATEPEYNYARKTHVTPRDMLYAPVSHNKATK